MTSACGQASVALLALIPALLTAVIVAISSLSTLKAVATSSHACRTRLLQAQDEALREIQRLKALNPEATSLRAARAAAEAKLAIAIASGNAPAVAAVRAEIEMITVKQVALRSQQMRIWTTAQSAGRTHLHMAAQAIRNQVRSGHLDPEAAPSRTPAVETNISLFAFSVRQTPPNSLTPNFETTNDFERRQILWIEWHFLAKDLLPEWISRFLPDGPLKLQLQCAVGVERDKAADWSATLTRVRPSLKL